MNHWVLAYLRESLSKRIDEASQKYRPSPKLNSALPGYEITALTLDEESPERVGYGTITAEITFWGDQNFLELEQMAARVERVITQDTEANQDVVRIELPEPFEVSSQKSGGISEAKIEKQYTLVLGFVFKVFEAGCN